MESNILLVGLGPHANRIYLRFIKNNNYNLRYVVDLCSREVEINKYLSKNGFTNIPLYLLEDKYRNFNELEDKHKKDLRLIIEKEKITHAIISTEPKAHYAYLKFFIEEGINVLLDKPVIVEEGLTTSQEARDLLVNKMNMLCVSYREKYDYMNVCVMCQRRYSDVYVYLKQYIKEIINEYNIGITNMHISTCDGMWNMPDEFFFRENHPYKYGYGKIMHSGYHFIDLALYLLEENKNLVNKEINKVSIQSSAFYPNDFFATFNNLDYKKLFKEDIDYSSYMNLDNSMMGEIDVHSIIDFKDKENHLLTTVTMDLMQSGFTRRAWTMLPEDTYKGNGRTKHNFIEINLGPLVSIKILAFQALSKEEGHMGINVGENDHFEVQIYRNNKLIGGKLLEIKQISDFTDMGNDFFGYNEIYREYCLKDFINNQKGKSDLLEQERTMYLTKLLYDSLTAPVSVNFDLKGCEE